MLFYELLQGDLSTAVQDIVFLSASNTPVLLTVQTFWQKHPPGSAEGRSQCQSCAWKYIPGEISV